MKLTILGGGGVRMPAFVRSVLTGGAHHFDEICLLEPDQLRRDTTGRLAVEIAAALGRPGTVTVTPDVGAGADGRGLRLLRAAGRRRPGPGHRRAGSTAARRRRPGNHRAGRIRHGDAHYPGRAVLLRAAAQVRTGRDPDQLHQPGRAYHAGHLPIRAWSGPLASATPRAAQPSTWRAFLGAGHGRPDPPRRSGIPA